MNKSTRYFSNKQEKHVAKSLKGRQTANSGATPFQKGDVELSNILVECKTKTSPSESMSIKKEWLEKNEEEAFAMGKPYSALCFSFGDLHNDRQYYIINEDMFKSMSADYLKEIETMSTRVEYIDIEINNIQVSFEERKQADEILKKYKHIKKLNKVIIDEFIDKVYVGVYDKETKTRDIEIEWNFEF